MRLLGSSTGVLQNLVEQRQSSCSIWNVCVHGRADRVCNVWGRPLHAGQPLFLMARTEIEHVPGVGRVSATRLLPYASLSTAANASPPLWELLTRSHVGPTTVVIADPANPDYALGSFRCIGLVGQSLRSRYGQREPPHDMRGATARRADLLWDELELHVSV
jgi:hypothetical protein